MAAKEAERVVIELADLMGFPGHLRRRKAGLRRQPNRMRSCSGAFFNWLATYPTALISVSAVFTIEEIDEVHERLGNANTLPEYVRSLRGLGVVRYDSFISDGHSEFFGRDGRSVVSHGVHGELTIAEKSHPEAFLEHLRCHERGETSYLEMSNGLAASGVEKWTVDTDMMTMTFCDQSGQTLLVKPIA